MNQIINPAISYRSRPRERSAQELYVRPTQMRRNIHRHPCSNLQSLSLSSSCCLYNHDADRSVITRGQPSPLRGWPTPKATRDWPLSCCSALTFQLRCAAWCAGDVFSYFFLFRTRAPWFSANHHMWLVGLPPVSTFGCF